METLKQLLGFHKGLRPLMQVDDFYKLLFQSVYGNGHILKGNPLGYLEQEAREMKWGIEDPLTEKISLDGSLIRVNLRPYVKAGNPVDLVYNMMIASNERRGSAEELRKLWSEFLGLYPQAASFRFPQGLPSHSAKYNKHYAPSYRVVTQAAFDDWMKKI